jgi:protein gp37
LSSATHIESTDATWNPVRGCTRVSEGCRHCYAERQAVRHARSGGAYEGLAKSTAAGPRWTGVVRFVPEVLDWPLRWGGSPAAQAEWRPSRIFVNSMSDLFHEGLGLEQIAAVFGVMAAAERHTFQVLTKRPARALEFFRWLPDMAASIGVAVDTTAQRYAVDYGAELPLHPVKGTLLSRPWPLPNVQLGVSVEDQTTADERIPLLLQCPAAVRFVSYEPALGPVNLRPGLRARLPVDPAAAYDDWGAFPWPEWVPSELRDQVASFWAPENGRGPAAYLRDAFSQGGPPLFSGGSLRRIKASEERIFGRFVHAWNNIGWVVDEHGVFTTGSFTGSGLWTATRLAGRGIDWVIVGGESGPGARPFDVAWARETVRQCREAGVALFVKQLGARPHEPYGEAPSRWGVGVRVDHAPGCPSGARYWIRLRDRKGGDWAEWPEDLRVREFPS